MIYLYVKQHNKTGLKYFGVTTKKNPHAYLGSGTYWRRHLRIHGNDISTIEVWEFDNTDECENFALEFSSKQNIVESKEWANLQPENGKPGQSVGSPGMKGESNPQFGRIKELNTFYGKKHTPENIELFKKRGLAQPSGGDSPNAKKVATPIGNFDCLKHAAKALCISDETLRQRLKKHITGYYFL
jgi:hypothetical protein